MVTRCSVCDAELSREAIEVECQHVPGEFVSATPATGSDSSANTETSKGSITHICATCGEEYTEAVNYSYYARTAYVSASIDTETVMMFGARYKRDFDRLFNNTALAGTTVNVTNGYIVLDQNRVDKDGLSVDIADSAMAFADCADTKDPDNYDIYQNKLGIVAYAMCDEVTSTVYAYDATTKAWYSGIQYTYSVKTLSEGILASSKDNNQKTMFVNLLEYGTAAQEYFSEKHNLGNIIRANADLTAEQKALATGPKAYDGAEMNMPILNNQNVFQFFIYKTNLVVEAQVTNRLFFRLPSSYTEANTAVDMTDYTLEVTYTDFLGETKSLIFTSDMFQPEGRTNRYYVDVAMPTPDLRSITTIVVKNAGVAAGPECTMSIENLVEGVIASSSDEAQIDLFNKVMAFGDAANYYLANK